MTPTRRIVALGGGGFSMEDNLVLDDYVLAASGVARPRVLFVPTAGGDAESYVEMFRTAFPPQRAEASVLTLFHRSAVDLRALVLAQDVVYVGGGSTANLLAVWRVHGLDDVLREAYASGVVLAGISAGMNCWFSASVTDSFGPLAGLPDGLGLLPWSACPHFDGEPERRPTYHRLIEAGFPDGYAADDGVGLLFTDEVFTEAVTSRPGASGYRVARVAGTVSDTPLPTRNILRGLPTGN